MTGRPAFPAVGRGEPVLLLLDGIGGNRSSFDAQLETFGRQRRAVARDMPGCGESPALPMTP